MTVADQLTLGLGGSHSRNAQTIFSGFCIEAKLGQNIISRWFQTEPKKANTRQTKHLRRPRGRWGLSVLIERPKDLSDVIRISCAISSALTVGSPVQ